MEALPRLIPITTPQRQPKKLSTTITVAALPRKISTLSSNRTARNVSEISCQLLSSTDKNRLAGKHFFCNTRVGLFGINSSTTLNPQKQSKHGIFRCKSGGTVISTAADANLTDATFGKKLRALCFYALTCAVGIPLFSVMLLLHPFVLLFDKHRREVHHLIHKVWASFVVGPFYKVNIEGLENLPPPNVPAVYVCNHQSFLDVYTVLLLGRSFKFISKTSIFLIPIIGWSMFLTGHIPLRRMDTRSQMECLKRCLDVLKLGSSVLFFPEGTRSIDGKMSAFKKGAFSVASKARVPVIPVTLIGTGNLMPNRMEGTLRPGSVKVIIDKHIEGADADGLCNKARAIIAERLLMHGCGVH